MNYRCYIVDGNNIQLLWMHSTIQTPMTLVSIMLLRNYLIQL